MKAMSLAAAVGMAALFIGGCAGSSKPASVPAAEKAPAVKESGAFYAEETYKGRLYVFGTEKAHKSFKEAEQVPTIAKTFIGAGPEGQTLVLEADSKANGLQDRLRTEYESRHATKLP